jgi:hypothetical protein
MERPTSNSSKRRPHFETRTCLGGNKNLGHGSWGDWSQEWLVMDLEETEARNDWSWISRRLKPGTTGHGSRGDWSQEWLVMDLEETEARNDCGGKGQQQFDRPTDRPTDQPTDRPTDLKVSSAVWCQLLRVGSQSRIDSWSWRLTFGSKSNPGASSWRKCQLKPAVGVGGWREMVTSL